MSLHQPADHAATARTGEGAFAIAEQLGLDQTFRDGGAVDRNKGFVGTRAGLVQGARHDLLAGAGLTQQQHRQIIVQAPASHAQGSGQACIAAGQGFQLRRFRCGERLAKSSRRTHGGTLRQVYRAEEKLALGGLHAVHPVAPQAGEEG
ncbi:hypothetical protein D3C76_1064090 [compost metagenome]